MASLQTTIYKPLRLNNKANVNAGYGPYASLDEGVKAAIALWETAAKIPISFTFAVDSDNTLVEYWCSELASNGPVWVKKQPEAIKGEDATYLEILNDNVVLDDNVSAQDLITAFKIYVTPKKGDTELTITNITASVPYEWQTILKGTTVASNLSSYTLVSTSSLKDLPLADYKGKSGTITYTIHAAAGTSTYTFTAYLQFRVLNISDGSIYDLQATPATLSEGSNNNNIQLTLSKIKDGIPELVQATNWELHSTKKPVKATNIDATSTDGYAKTISTTNINSSITYYAYIKNSTIRSAEFTATSSAGTDTFVANTEDWSTFTYNNNTYKVALALHNGAYYLITPPSSVGEITVETAVKNITSMYKLPFAITEPSDLTIKFNTSVTGTFYTTNTNDALVYVDQETVGWCPKGEDGVSVTTGFITEVLNQTVLIDDDITRDNFIYATTGAVVIRFKGVDCSELFTCDKGNSVDCGDNIITQCVNNTDSSYAKLNPNYQYRHTIYCDVEGSTWPELSTGNYSAKYDYYVSSSYTDNDENWVTEYPYAEDDTNYNAKIAAIWDDIITTTPQNITAVQSIGIYDVNDGAAFGLTVSPSSVYSSAYSGTVSLDIKVTFWKKYEGQNATPYPTSEYDLYKDDSIVPFSYYNNEGGYWLFSSQNINKTITFEVRDKEGLVLDSLALTYTCTGLQGTPGISPSAEDVAKKVVISGVMRDRGEWTAGLTYYQAETIDNVTWIDYVSVTTPNNTEVTAANPSFTYTIKKYKCLQNNTASADNKPENSAYWEEIAYSSTLIAGTINASTITAKELYLKDASLNITGGAVGGTKTSDSTNQLIFFAGSKYKADSSDNSTETTADEAPFRVYDNGDMYANNLIYSGWQYLKDKTLSTKLDKRIHLYIPIQDSEGYSGQYATYTLKWSRIYSTPTFDLYSTVGLGNIVKIDYSASDNLGNFGVLLPSYIKHYIDDEEYDLYLPHETSSVSEPTDTHTKYMNYCREIVGNKLTLQLQAIPTNVNIHRGVAGFISTTEVNQIVSDIIKGDNGTYVYNSSGSDEFATFYKVDTPNYTYAEVANDYILRNILSDPTANMEYTLECKYFNDDSMEAVYWQVLSKTIHYTEFNYVTPTDSIISDII